MLIIVKFGNLRKSMIAPLPESVLHKKCQPYLIKECTFPYNFVRQNRDLTILNKENNKNATALSRSALSACFCWLFTARWRSGSSRLTASFTISWLVACRTRRSTTPTSPASIRKRTTQRRRSRKIRSGHPGAAERGCPPHHLDEPTGDSSGRRTAGWTALLTSPARCLFRRDIDLPTIAHRRVRSVRPDSDNVLRQSELWQLNSGVMSPSLPLAIHLRVSRQRHSDVRGPMMSSISPATLSCREST